MAEDQSQEINKLNKNVESIMKHLGAQGSPAQSKKDAEQKSDNIKNESKLIDKKEDSEEESRKLFAGTMAAGTFVWKNLSTHIFSKINQVFGTLFSQIRDALGPIAAFYDSAKAALGSAFGFIKGVFTSFKDKATPAEEKTHGYLKRMVAWFDEQRRQAKAAFLGTIGEEKKESKMSMFAMAMFVIGAIIGGLISAILKPFTLLGKAIKGIASMIMKIPKVGKAIGRIGKFLRSITSAFAKLPGVGKIGSMLGKLGKFFKSVGSVIGKVLKGVGRVLKWILGKIPGVSGLLKGLKYGFKVLGWPIAILFGIIDFIKGFIAEFGESGNIIDSIGEGLRSALIGFIELPVKMVGWLIDKVLGWFGVEGADSANKMLGWINDAFDFVFGIIKWYWTTLIGYFKMVFGMMWDLIKPFVETVWPEIKEWIDLIFEGIKMIFGGLWDKVKGIWDWFGDDEDEPSKPTPNTPPKTKRLTEAEKAAELEKIRVEQRQIAAKAKADKEAAAAAEKGGKAVVVSSNVTGGSGGEVPQIPDEVDNWGVTSKNYDMEMF